MDAPFYPPTDTPSHKGGGSIVFLTTNMERIAKSQQREVREDTAEPMFVAIRIEHGERVGRGPNPQELLALLGAAAVTQRMEPRQSDHRQINSDCKSLVDYVNHYRYTRMRNEVGKLPFLMAIQHYMQEDPQLEIRWVRSHPERRKEMEEFDLDEWGIYVADCFASNKSLPRSLRGDTYVISADCLVRHAFPTQLWYLGDSTGLPVMMDPKRRYQDKAMLQYWTQRDHQVGHDIIYQGSSTYMMYTVGQLRYSSPRQRARKVKLMLDWGVHGRRMQLMGLDKSGKCPICMETDSLDHLAFACNYSAANHRRQAWVEGTESAVNRLTKENQKRPRWLGEARETLLQELKEMYMRHPSRLLLWRGL